MWLPECWIQIFYCVFCSKYSIMLLVKTKVNRVRKEMCMMLIVIHWVLIRMWETTADYCNHSRYSAIVIWWPVVVVVVGEYSLTHSLVFISYWCTNEQNVNMNHHNYKSVSGQTKFPSLVAQLVDFFSSFIFFQLLGSYNYSR